MRGVDELDRLLAEHFRNNASPGADSGATARVLDVLAKPLPPQRRSLRHWPAALLRWDFAPAWPSVAALAGCAVIGFAIGTLSLSPQAPDTSQATARGDLQLVAVLSEPEAMTGALP